MYRIAPAVLLAPTVVVAEVIDFESADLGSVPAGWSVSMTSEGGPPRWEIQSDATAAGGPNVLAQLSTDRTSGRFPLAIYEGARLTDGAISVKFKPISGRVDQAAGLVWRYADENNYYIVRANALENNVVLYKVEDGKRITLAPVGQEGDYGVEHTVPAQRWSTLGVAFSGSKFSVLFDGVELFQVEDSTFPDAGRVGVWTKADSVVQFDHFEVSGD
jgi:hypothetical protein